MSRTKGGRSRKSRKRYRKVNTVQNTYVLDNAQSIKWLHLLKTLQRLDLCSDSFARIPMMKTVSVAKTESRQGYYSIDWSAQEQRKYVEYYI